ncbi:hypothetical protein [Wenzhouxiangella marina]|uniref:Uncharacterized protein n=1 Tax=Wenzhouxiangella marina TaxID=1579979 RepID=A0A0K0XTR0_9GAMM|nr:hypothetical protein [Wenzhouxiangella marina]AKS41099.1 hypothetical protein WM2015_718 [Wenzhouxiangella marina]MBB6087978.1 hypothetical protein [Wenzhouxiangella marina]
MTDSTISGLYGPAIPQPRDFSDALDGLVLSCDTPQNPVVNCSFETGDYTGWVTQDFPYPDFFFEQQVAGPTYVGYTFFTSSPVDGVFSSLNGFDGAGPGTIELGQDISLPAGSSLTLEFAHRAAWDLYNYGGGTLDRQFDVVIEPSGGGAPIETFPVLTASPGELVLDTGVTIESIDLSAYAGQSVRLNFVWTVPEAFTGPAFFEIDNVSVVAGAPPGPVQPSFAVPMLDVTGLLVLGAMTWALASKVLGSRS